MEGKTVFQGRFIEVELRKSLGHDREIIIACDSAAVLIYNRQLRKVVMVQQPRPAMENYSNPAGIITEVIAGRMNKPNLTLKGLIVLEIEEEIEVRVSEDDVLIINGLQSLAMTPGMCTERCYLALVEIPAKSFPKEGSVFGVREEGEKTRPIIFSFEDLDSMVYEDMKTFGIAQYFLRQIEKYERSRVR